MNPTVPALLVAAAVVVGLVLVYRRMRTNDHLETIMLRHRPTAKITSRAELVDGANHILVALTLEQKRIFYENPDLQADLDISQIDEVEYGSDLLTGQISQGSVLRLRAHGKSIEFVLDSAAARSWSEMLPAHRLNEAGTVHAT